MDSSSERPGEFPCLAGALALVLIICGYLLWILGRPVQAPVFGSVVAVGWLQRSGEPFPAPGRRNRIPHRRDRQHSFPVGHMAFALSLALADGAVQRPAVLAAGSLFVAMVAFSRLYRGVHYLSDVIGSVLISSAAILDRVPV